MTDIDTRFKELWDLQVAGELEDVRSGDIQPDEWYTSGRVSKEFPQKENPAWWAAKGPGFVKSWESFRDNCGLDIWTTPDGEPAIEIEVRAKQGKNELLCYIDRVMVDEHDRLYVVDIKSGVMTDPWPRQLALNNLGLLHTFGVWATFGGYWKARSGGVDPWFDLRIYSEEWLWEQVRVAREIRDQQLFAAQPNNLCKSACGVSPYCLAMGGPLSLTIASLTHNKENG